MEALCKDKLLLILKALFKNTHTHFKFKDILESLDSKSGNPLYNEDFFLFKSTTVLYLLDWNKSIPNFTVKSKNPMYFQRSRETIISIYVLYLHNTKIHRRLNFTKCTLRNFKSTRFINSGINYMHCLIILWGENLIWTVSSFLFYQF